MELAWVMSVSIDGLRPWEWWQMDSEEYDMIRELQSAYQTATKDAKAALRKDQP